MGPVLAKLRTLIQRLSKYPKIGKFIGTIFAVLEVPILEMMHLIDKKIRKGTYQQMMKAFSLFYGSKIIPLNVKINGNLSVAPTDEILGIIRRMPAVSIGYCYCRTKHQNCDNPIWSCIHIGTAIHLEELGKKIPLKSSSIEDVEKLIMRANELGLVHQLLTSPNPDYVYVICNCCPCCCVMLKSAIEFNIKGLAIPSNFITNWDSDGCIHCGICAQRCYFGALTYTENKLHFDQTKCVGCGLCVSVCENQALNLTQRNHLKAKIN